MKKIKFKHRPLFIVEGHQESDFITELRNRNLCGDLRKRMLRCNGKKVALGVLAQRIIDIIKDVNEDCTPIVVLFDRENRTETTEEIISTVKKELEIRGIDIRNFVIGVTDRKIESWMLPFVDESGKYPVEPTKGHDGSSGLGELTRRLKRNKIIYQKRETGIKILLEIDATELARVSKSFNSFYMQVNEHCKWHKRRT